MTIEYESRVFLCEILLNKSFYVIICSCHLDGEKIDIDHNLK